MTDTNEETLAGPTTTEVSEGEPTWMDASNDSLQQQQQGTNPAAGQAPSVLSTFSSASSDDSVSDVTMTQFLGAVANLCSATLGAGILALPFAMYQSGLIFGVLLLLVGGWATATSISLLVEACDTFCASTYEAVVEKLLGRTWRQVVEISILVFCSGTTVAYVIAVGDILERVEDVTGHQKQLAMCVVWALAMLPLSCLRRMQSLQCASSVGIISIATLVLAAAVHLFMPSDDPKDDAIFDKERMESFLWPNKGTISVLQACPIFFFAFSCQVNVAQIYDELPGPPSGSYQSESRIKTMKWVTYAAVTMCALLYASISFLAILDFGGDVKPNVLSCYSLSGRESALLHIAFLAMALAVVIAFPLNVFPARVSIIQMWEAAMAKRTVEELLICTNNEEAREPLISSDGKFTNYTESTASSMERGLEDPLHPITPSQEEDYVAEKGNACQHILVTLLLAGLALGLALVVPNISVVFGLLGGTTSALLGFVVPGLLGLKMNQSDWNAWILVVAGTTIGVLTTIVTVYATLF